MSDTPEKIGTLVEGETFDLGGLTPKEKEGLSGEVIGSIQKADSEGVPNVILEAFRDKEKIQDMVDFVLSISAVSDRGYLVPKNDSGYYEESTSETERDFIARKMREAFISLFPEIGQDAGSFKKVTLDRFLQDISSSIVGSIERGLQDIRKSREEELYNPDRKVENMSDVRSIGQYMGLRDRGEEED